MKSSLFAFFLCLCAFFLFVAVVDGSSAHQKRGILSNLSNLFGGQKNQTSSAQQNSTKSANNNSSSSSNAGANNNGTKVNETVAEKKQQSGLGAEPAAAATKGNNDAGGSEGNELAAAAPHDRSLLGDAAKKLLAELKKLVGMAEKVVNEVNEKAHTWTAKLTHFANWTKEEKQALMGLSLSMAEDTRALKLNKTEEGTSMFKASLPASIPKQFDARQQWSACSPVIGAIADQSSCGSCWAVSTASVYTDRLCIQMVKANKKPDVKARYSAMDLMTCDKQNKGCNGGVPKYAWDYITKNGIVTGSEWVDKSGCKPYPFAPKKFKNNQNEQGTPSCASACSNQAYSTQYPRDKKYATNPTGWSGAGLETRMQQEIMANGPITVGMAVHEDLMYYSGGIYTHVTGASLGGHAVRIIGWGEDRGVKYWLVANSWNTEWGERGLFRIRRGTDEERIESLHIAFGTPKI